MSYKAEKRASKELKSVRSGAMRRDLSPQADNIADSGKIDK